MDPCIEFGCDGRVKWLEGLEVLFGPSMVNVLMVRMLLRCGCWTVRSGRLHRLLKLFTDIACVLADVARLVMSRLDGRVATGRPEHFA